MIVVLTAFVVMIGVGGCATPTSAPRDGDVREGGEDTVPPPSDPSADLPSADLPSADLLTAELATVGWDGISGAPVVLLRELASGQVLPIWIGVAEARAIAMALHSIEAPRPMTHDLLANVLAQLNATLEEVAVIDLRNNTYYGRLKILVDGSDAPHWIDSRPSDGLALALRTGAVIRVAQKLLDEQPDFQFMAPEGADQVVRLLGMTVKAADAAAREKHSLPDQAGVLVVAVSGKAETAGLEPGDLVVEANGTAINEPVDILDVVRDAPITGVLELRVLRAAEDGEIDEKTFELPLEMIPDREPTRTQDDVVA